MKISKFNFNFHKRLITILTILLSISSCFQLIALLTVPVTNKLTLCKFDGYEFGVFGVCKDGSCTHVGIGYKPDERIGYGPSQQSENYEFSLPSNARHSISYLLVVHPIATGFNIIELLLVVSLFNQNLSNSTNYLLAILLFMLPTFLLTLLSFLVDILLFLPHLQWCGWTLLGSTVLIAVSGTILCIMRRTVSSRKSHWQNLRNTGNDLYSLNLLYDDSNESSDDYNYDRYSSSLTSSNLQELNLISTKNNNSYHNSSSTYSNNINNNNNNNNNNSNNNNNNNNNNTNTHIIQQNPFEIDQVADNSEEKLDNLVLRNKIIGDSGTVVIKRKPISDHNINSHESPIHELKFTYPTKSQPPFTTNNASSYPDMTYPNNTNNNNNDIDEEELLIKPGRSRRIQSPKRLRSADYSPPKIISNPIRSMFDFNDEINETQSEPIAQLDSTNLNRFKSFKSEHTSSIFMDLNDLKNELYPDTEVSYSIGDDTTDHMETNINRIKSLTLQEKLMNELNNTENNESSHDGNVDHDDDDDDYEDIESDEEDQDDHFKSSTRSLPVRPLVILKGPRNKPADYNSPQSASKYNEYNEQHSKDDDTDNDDSDNNSRTTSSAFLSTTSSYYPNTNSVSHKHNQNSDNNSMNSYSTKSSNELFDAKSVMSEVSNNIENNITDNIDKLKENFVLSLSSDSSSSDYSILNGEDLFKLNKQKQLKPESGSNSNSGSNSGSGSESGVLSDTTNFTSISQRPINPRYLEMERLYNQQQQQRIQQQQGQYHNNNNQSMKFKKMSRNPIIELSDDIIKNERISKNNHANIVNNRNNNNQRIGYNVNFT